TMALWPARPRERHAPVGGEALDALLMTRSAARADEPVRFLEVSPGRVAAAACAPDSGQVQVGLGALVARVRRGEGCEGLLEPRRRLRQVAAGERHPPERLLRPPHRD